MARGAFFAVVLTSNRPQTSKRSAWNAFWSRTPALWSC